MRRFQWFMMLALLVLGCETKVKTQDSCGDGFQDPGEACDGSDLGGQDCVSLGFHENAGAPVCTAGCAFDTSACGARCGDNTVDVAHGEVCDSQQLSANTCQTLGFTGGALACGADCDYDTTGCVSVCGNGVVEPDEGCDDGGTAPDDGCAADCAVEAGWDCSGSPSVCVIVRCGDGVAAGDEACDGADLRGQGCESLDYHGGALACREDCTLDLLSCEAAGRCGDGARQEGHEACDGADLGGATCESLGWNGGTGTSLSCEADCTFNETACEANGRCGDGVLQTPYEVCDGDLLPNTTCATAGSFTGTPTCGADCAFDLSGCHDAVALSTGMSHGCVLDDLGRAFCWGEGAYGRLGDGGLANRFTPVAVTLPNGVAFSKISAGGSHTCALGLNGIAYCWGYGFAGRLGNGAVTDQSLPTPVTMPAARTFTTIASGGAHTCAIDDLGRGWCWGAGGTSQLGNGGWSDVSVPTLVSMPSATTFTAITAGFGHTCAITNTTAIRCWGYNNSGQVGNGTTSNVTTPAGLNDGGRGYVDVHAGYLTTCAVAANGDVYCWGHNNRGQVGDGTFENKTSPVRVQMPAGVSSAKVAVSAIHACAVATTGALYCWGGGDDGELGMGQGLVDARTPSLVPGLNGVLAVDARDKGTCALTAPGKTWCWGTNDLGQVGVNVPGSTFHDPTPVASP